MCNNVLPLYVCNTSMPGALGREERGLDPLNWKLLMAVSLCMGSGSSGSQWP